MSSWDNAYRTTPPWDIGRPQPAFVDLAMNRELESKRVLDLGCGTGENAIFLAENGYSVIGIDAARTAVEAAKSKASARGVRVDFRVGNALSLELDRATFDNVIDSGLFHTFSDSDRQVFAAQVGRVLRGGGKYFMLCFSEKEPID